ncbi:MAG: hypothetical protein ACTSRG_23915 [Candidatus Helarchaeota archaeon]
MKTKIIEIVDNKEKGIIVKFMYFDKLRFTYLTLKSLIYWKSRGVQEFKIGDEINVFKVPQSKFYRIVELVEGGAV